MTGQAAAISDAFTDTTIKVIYPDKQRVVPGTLFLADLGHSTGGITGVPTDGATVPNLAALSAMQMAGGGTAASLAGIVKRTDTAATHKIERTAKGGLHAVYTASADASGSGKGISLNLPDAVKQWILDHPTHKYYFNMWHAVTRAASATSIYGGITSTVSPSNNILFLNRTSTTVATGGYALTTPSKNTVGPTYESIGPVGWLNTLPASIATMLAYPWQVGAQYALPANTGFSDIFYACMLEDMTVSGRTIAQLDAINQAQFAAAFAPGGNFYGDTFTAPSTLP